MQHISMRPESHRGDPPRATVSQGLDRPPGTICRVIRVGAACLAFLAVLSLAACDDSEGSGSSDLPTSGGTPTGAVQEGLERFYAQRLTWGECADFATTERDREAYSRSEFECTRIEVPLDYALPGGRTASLGLLRRPAEDQAARIGSLVVNPGGPGVSGMSSAASLAGKVDGNSLGARFDLVGFDPRGVGSSTPTLKCLTTEETDAERLDDDLDTSPAGVAQTEQEEKDYVAKCVQRVGAEVLANSGTRDVARDLDIIRSVLGDEKLTFLGYSYGTGIGTKYAEQFGSNVRAMVLDGAIDPNQPLVDSVVNQGAGFQLSFTNFVNACVEEDDCWTKNKASANADFQRLLAPLQAGPRDVGGRKLSYSDAITGTVQALYSDQLWPILDNGLKELANGGGRIMMLLADLYYQREDDGYSGSEDAFTAIRCVDDLPVTDPNEVREADRRYREAAPFLDDGRGVSSARNACAFWPVPPTSQPGAPKLDNVAPAVVVSTTGDPATPYQAGVDLARQLGGRLLTNDGNQHTIALQGKRCVDVALISYLVDLTLPPEGLRCAA